MQREDRIRLAHMRDAAMRALEYAELHSQYEADIKDVFVQALIRMIEIVGEAASRVSTKVKDQMPKIEWHKIINMRNRLVHAYFDVDEDIVWTTVKQDLQPLVITLNAVLESEPD